ncbi:UNVERIFIED_CONTAM: hypothetical protein FKN15_020934 [Acipenser sinensis]
MGLRPQRNSNRPEPSTDSQRQMAGAFFKALAQQQLPPRSELIPELQREPPLRLWPGGSQPQGLSSPLNSSHGWRKPISPPPAQRQPSLWQSDMDTASTPSHIGEQYSRLIKPGKFNGTDWETYATKFQVITQVNGWTASEKTAHLVAALDGPAEQALLDLPYGQEFEALCTALQGRFKERPSELELHDRLYARRREGGEKLGVLAADIQQLARRAFKDAPPELTGRLALDLFIRSLFPSELRRHVHLAHPRSITQALEKAKVMEAILMEQSSARRRSGTRAVQAADLPGT